MGEINLNALDRYNVLYRLHADRINDWHFWDFASTVEAVDILVQSLRSNPAVAEVRIFGNEYKLAEVVTTTKKLVRI